MIWGGDALSQGKIYGNSVTYLSGYDNLVLCEERTSKSAETKHGQSSALFLILKYSQELIKPADCLRELSLHRGS